VLSAGLPGCRADSRGDSGWARPVERAGQSRARRWVWCRGAVGLRF